MENPPSLPHPVTRMVVPSSATSALLRAVIMRDTRGCELEGDRLLNRFPASSHCVITWFLEGNVELLSCGGKAQRTLLPRCVISGCQTAPFMSRNCGDVHALMAVFYPDAFHALFGIDLASLRNRFVDAREILPPDGLALVDAVLGTPDFAEQRQLIERFVQERAHAIDVPLWSRIRRAGNKATLAMASSALGIGPRQLQRLALRRAGANLQTLVRLWRGERSFLRALRQHNAGAQLAWADHAAACDYADQSHMARECKAQTGRTPAQLARDVQNEEADWIYRLEFPYDEDPPPSRSK